MDCLVEKNGVKTELSSIDVLVTDFKDSSPVLNVTQREVRNRSGFIFSGAVHKEKSIVVSGKFQTDTVYESEEKKDELNSLFSSDEPFYITKMLPTSDLYEFELPGQTEGFELLGIPCETYKYRYKVIPSSEIDYNFLGKSSAGLLTEFSITLKTAELPFGETLPTNETITSGFIEYRGTARCSQLEWPWTVKLVSKKSQIGRFSVTIGDRTFESYSLTPIRVGDIFLLKGVEALKNYSNFNESTNYEHFELKPYPKNQIPISTDFAGTIELLNKTELYI
ncbi:phage tail domain-containing protein [Enterococcus sp. DIV0800]|uniref:phage tail domain-containing protein n=1 Tax=unclassified Enterococcus TaxID=2608891 RepID=UPI003D2FEA05